MGDKPTLPSKDKVEDVAMRNESDLFYAAVTIEIDGVGRGAAQGVQHDMSLDLSPGRGGERLAGPSTQGLYRITRRPDKLSPSLYSACANALVIPEVIVTIRRPDTMEPATWPKWLVTTMTDVLITSVETSVGADEGALEKLSLNYLKIDWTWRGDEETNKGSWSRN